MTGQLETSGLGLDITQLAEIDTVAELAEVLRRLRRRHARQLGDSPLTYRELAAKTGWAHGVIGGYFTGHTLAPTDRFDVLVELLGATNAERYALATARDRVEEQRRCRDNTRSPAVARAVPRELPSDVGAFTGRAAQLAELSRLLDDTDTPAVVISAVAGTAGVGKTALAVHWAHRVRDRFRDGCLYVDLRGYGPDRPVRPDDALAMLLRSLGVPDASIPSDPAERAARYRTMVADRRMLILFDNANDATQVRPLLPGTPSCRTIITSRDHLASLVARDGAWRIDLDTLPDNESRQLLGALIGARALSEPDSTRALVAYCCGLPLALRVAAEYAIARPARSLADLVTELADQRRRLDVLDERADESTAIRAVFSWSYRALAPDAARAFRLFGLHPGRDLDDHALAALVATPVTRARQLAGELTRAFLVRPVGDGRYAMHDLLRAYAAEQAAADPDRGPARTRLYEHYVHAAGVAATLMYPADAPQRPPLRPVTSAVPALANGDEALTWLDAERDNLIAAGIAAATDSPPHAVDLSLTLGRYLYVANHNADGLLLHGHARDAARGRGDRAGEANVLRYLGITNNMLANFDDALHHYGAAMAILDELGDVRGRGNVLTNMGIVEARTGRHEDAYRTCTAALAAHRATGNTFGEGVTLNNLGHICTLTGRYAEAVEHLRRSLEVRRAAGEESGGTCTLSNLGGLYTRLGQYDEALEYHRQALETRRAARDRVGEGETRSAMGETYLLAGRPDEALDHLSAALEIGRDTGERSLTVRTLNILGETLLATGRDADAAQRHVAACAIAVEIGDAGEQARAQRGLGHVRHAEGRWPAARTHWERAMAGYAELGMPEAEEIRRLLSALDAPDE